MSSDSFQLIELRPGVWSVFALQERETMHPVVGPTEETRRLYLVPLRILERLPNHQPFVIWDVGLGAGGVILNLFNECRILSSHLKVISFDQSIAPVRFALQHLDKLPWMKLYSKPVQSLLDHGRVTFDNHRQSIDWTFFQTNFPHWLNSPVSHGVPAPNAILFDAWSPAKNPAMWSFPLFQDLFRCLKPQSPCSLATYSRATMVRTAMLLAGFFVGTGDGVGAKEETTIAANSLDLLDRPLGKDWLGKVRRSTAAEPLADGTYRQQPISDANWEALIRHPQFQQA